MIDDLQITVLAENTARGVNLLGEHGLAFWIEADGCRILFDTGQGKVLHHNAQCLEVPLDAAEMVVISHGHFDHTGGLKDVLDTAGKIDLYLHPAALEEKYYREKTPPHRSIGIPDLDEQALRGRTRNLVWTGEPTKLVEGVYLTGEIPRRNDFEDTGGPFYRDQSCTEADPLLDDQALYIETPAGTVVVLGCAHAGVVNTLDYIAELTGQARVYAVLGGMHLVRATARRLEATVAALKRYGVQKVGTAHCTGMCAASYLWSQLPDECFECSVGSVFTVQNGTDNAD
jgi:7,8-dihydropterin-6-yl-methyl-4-(beta-D-ribofuranosyl)aminobenzene 5'-phosphate synthase